MEVRWQPPSRARCSSNALAQIFRFSRMTCAEHNTHGMQPCHQPSRSQRNVSNSSPEPWRGSVFGVVYLLNSGTVLHASPYMRLFTTGRKRDTNSTQAEVGTGYLLHPFTITRSSRNCSTSRVAKASWYKTVSKVSPLPITTRLATGSKQVAASMNAHCGTMASAEHCMLMKCPAQRDQSISESRWRQSFSRKINSSNRKSFKSKVERFPT